MTSFIHADIFFFIASIGFVFIFILAIIALAYLISVFRKIHRLTTELEKRAKNIEASAEDIIDAIRSSAVFRLLFGNRASRTTAKKSERTGKKAARKE